MHSAYGQQDIDRTLNTVEQIDQWPSLPDHSMEDFSIIVIEKIDREDTDYQKKRRATELR